VLNNFLSYGLPKGMRGGLSIAFNLLKHFLGGYPSLKSGREVVDWAFAKLSGDKRERFFIS
jgi:hypothetical protein